VEPEPLSSSGNLGVDLIWQILLLVVLLFLSGFFSGSETALTSMSKLKIRKMLEKTKKREKKRILHEALHRPNRLLTTILIMNNFINILASSLTTLLVLSMFPEGDSAGIAAAISTGVMTILILIFGEITPKVQASQSVHKIFNRTISIVTFLSYALSPIIWLLIKISNFFIWLTGGKRVIDPPFITEDEIVYAMQVGEKEGVIELEERKMLTRALGLKDTNVKEIMIPRVDMVAIDEDDDLNSIISLVTEEGYSRYPVYRESIDNVIGLLYAKDILKTIDEKGPDFLTRVTAREIVRQPFFVPETKKIDDLLQEFKDNLIHMAIVVDEYGGTEGLVTIEDIIEEVMGEIMDEFDEDEETGIEKIGENSYIIDAKVPINDIEREIDIEFPETEFESVGGYLFEVFEKVPEVGEEIDVNGFHFKILAASKSKIEKIKLTIKKKSAENIIFEEEAKDDRRKDEN